jgi:hypothetical protein
VPLVSIWWAEGRCVGRGGRSSVRPLRVLCLHGKHENAAAFALRTAFLDDFEPRDGLREVRAALETRG